MNKKMPPATDTFSDSNSPPILMLTSSDASRAFPEIPLPSLPKTRHNFVSIKEHASSFVRQETGPSLLPGSPARIFILNPSTRDCKSDHWPETIGSWNDAPRLALSAFSLKGSQHPGSRKAPSCHQSMFD
ncbi:hypothetical protein Hanom_Chr09g00812571 [Helianthus anomalus]